MNPGFGSRCWWCDTRRSPEQLLRVQDHSDGREFTICRPSVAGADCFRLAVNRPAWVQSIALLVEHRRA